MGARKKFGIGIRLMIMAVCYLLAVRYAKDVQDAAQIAVVSFADGGVTDEMAESICGEERSLCFWREQKDMQFSCRETGNTVQATGLLTEGDQELVAKGSGILAWQEGGCVVDTATAQELFGTQQVNGQLLWCGGEAFTVYGTFESLKRMVVFRTVTGRNSGDSEETTFDHVSVRAQQGMSARASVEQLLMRCGLEGDIADFVFPDVICGNLLLVLPVVLAAGLAGVLWGCMWMGLPGRQTVMPEQTGVTLTPGRKRKTEWFVCAVMLAAVIATFCFVLRNHLYIPTDMIPTRWSDFSFWTQWWAGQKKNLLQILGSAQGEIQLGALWSFGLSVSCDFLAIGFGISFLHAEQ